MSDVSYYKILGVKPDASPVEIKTAYRRAARANHPDSGLPGAGALFPLIQEAWDTLSDDAKRTEYDRKLNGGPTSSSGSSQSHQSDSRGHSNRGGEPGGNGGQAPWIPQQTPVKPQQTPWGGDAWGNSVPDQREYAGVPQSPANKEQPNVVDFLKSAPRQSVIKVIASMVLWLVWAVLCFIIVKGIGKDGVIFAFLAFFLTLGLTFLLARFSRNLAPVYAFVFAAITLPLPVAGLVTTGVSPTSLIFLVPAIGMTAALGDHFLRRRVQNSGA